MKPSASNSVIFSLSSSVKPAADGLAENGQGQHTNQVCGQRHGEDVHINTHAAASASSSMGSSAAQMPAALLHAAVKGAPRRAGEVELPPRPRHGDVA